MIVASCTINNILPKCNISLGTVVASYGRKCSISFQSKDMIRSSHDSNNIAPIANSTLSIVITSSSKNCAIIFQSNDIGIAC